MATLGFIGFGFIGQSVYQRITQHHPDIKIKWVFDINPLVVKDLPASQLRHRLEETDYHAVDLVVEMAHADAVHHYAIAILKHCAFMPISLTAFADEMLYQNSLTAAKAAGTRLYIPHGGTLGMDTIYDSRTKWENVTIITRKNPDNIVLDQSLTTPVVLYNGPTRGICSVYPCNVNTHAAVAMAGIGFDKTHSILISDPDCDGTEFSVEAVSPENRVMLKRHSKMQGVSSTSLPDAVFSSIERVLRHDAMVLC